jgi:hypothetical protein|tara:strand:+ start:58 stop:621 length:564 start_codon:yes stop_codon:yes gene_type:complete
MTDHVSQKVNEAKDPETPSHILEHLSNDTNWRVRSGVALNPNAPPEVLAKLAHSKQRNIRFRVAHNPNTPEEVLHWLVVDKGGETVAKELETRKMYEKLYNENKIKNKIKHLNVSDEQKNKLKKLNSIIWIKSEISQLPPRGSAFYRYYSDPKENPPSYDKQCQEIIKYANKNSDQLPYLLTTLKLK